MIIWVKTYSNFKSIINKKKKCIFVFCVDNCELCDILIDKIKKYNSYSWYICKLNKDFKDVLRMKEYTSSPFPNIKLFYNGNCISKYGGVLYDKQFFGLLSEFKEL